MSLNFSITRNPNILSAAAGREVSQEETNDIVAPLDHHCGAQYELRNNRLLRRLQLQIFACLLLAKEEMFDMSDELIESNGLDPVLAGFMKGQVLNQRSTKLLTMVDNQGELFTPPMFVMNMNDLTKPGRKDRPVRRVWVDAHNFDRVTASNGQVSSRPNRVGTFMQRVNTHGTFENGGERDALIMGFRPEFEERRDTAVITSKDQVLKSYILLVIGANLDLLMQIVDIAGDSVAPMFFGGLVDPEMAYFGPIEVQDTKASTDPKLKMDEIREKVKSTKLTHTMAQGLEGVVIDDEDESPEDSSDDVSDDLSASDGNEDETSDASSTEESDGDIAPPVANEKRSDAPLTAKQKRMLENSEEGKTPSTPPATTKKPKKASTPRQKKGLEDLENVQLPSAE